MDVLAAILTVVAIVLVGLIAGAESATWVVHATVDRLPGHLRRKPAQAINQRMGSLMPMIMPPAVLVCVGAGVISLPGLGGALLLVATGALVIMLLITFLGLAPLNKKEEAATEDTPESDWQAWRSRWLRLHGLRVVCDVLALVAVSIAAVVG